MKLCYNLQLHYTLLCPQPHYITHTYTRRMMESLGSGQFGMVNKAVWQSPQGEVEVAVKMLKEGSDISDRVKFLQEAAIMGQFKHHNVVQLYGLVVGEAVSI